MILCLLFLRLSTNFAKIEWCVAGWIAFFGVTDLTYGVAFFWPTRGVFLLPAIGIVSLRHNKCFATQYEFLEVFFV